LVMMYGPAFLKVVHIGKILIVADDFSWRQPWRMFSGNWL